MKSDLQEAIAYFSPQKDYFWRWADGGQVVEWQNGITICYRAELVELLRQLDGQHIVPLSSVLLFMAACSDGYKTSGGDGILAAIARDVGYINKKETEILLRQSLDFMDALAGLPKDVKNSVVKKAHIIHECFQLQHNLSNLTWLFLADELDSGRINILKPTTLLHDKFNGDLGFLSAAGLIYPTTERLVMKVLTGMPEIPQPLEVVIPEPENKDLLGQLSQDPSTAGISYLTKHLIAALNIPMHSQGIGNQPLGGISDITNKGSYDKLLLSELAQDEELLTARLVNNEALYFKREESPEDVNRKRVILLDTTLKMWGKPRVFGISAALACTLNTKHGETIEAYALEGDYYQSIDLATTKGIQHSLQQLNPALHCGKALNTLINEQAKTDNDEYIFITGDWQHQPYDFQALFSNSKTSLNFIISVGREGDLNLYECINGNTKLLNTTKFDLDEILFQKAQVGKRENLQKKYLDTRIAFLNQAESPLYFPTPQSLRLTTGNSYFYYESHASMSVIAITEDRRLLFWLEKGHGAVEIMDDIEVGNYYFGRCENKGDYQVLVSKAENGNLILYSFNTNKTVEKHFISKSSINIKNVLFDKDKFHITGGTFHNFIVDCTTKRLVLLHDDNSYFIGKEIKENNKQDSYARKLVNPGYDTLSRFSTIKISNDKKLFFDKRELQSFYGDTPISLKEPANYTEEKFGIFADASDDFFEVEGINNIKFKTYNWNDGSSIIVDSRGFAHLISANKNIPQVTIVLIINRTLAYWSADGKVCGSEYFISKNSEKISTNTFYKEYIQPFIDNITANAINA